MASDFTLSALIDFPDDALHGVYHSATVDAMMAKLREMGVRRIYWNYYGPYDDGFVWRKYVREGDESVVESYRILGDVIGAAVQAAKSHGLEFYSVIKPYETGFSMIYPEGSPEAAQYGVLPHLGSRIPQVMKFVAEHPGMRIRRRMDDIPADLATTPVQTIRLFKCDDRPTRIQKENLEIWTSDRNYQYRCRERAFDYCDQVTDASRDFADMDGNVLAARGAPVRTLTLTGLDLTDKFILVTTNFEEGKADFENAALHMIAAYGPDGRELPISVGHGLSVWCSNKVDFRNWGLEFDNGLSRCVVQLDAPNRSPSRGPWSGSNGFVALVRGRNEYLPAAVCGGYPEVRQFWLSHVQACLDAGVDGVDFRIENHCTHTDDPFAYGFNDVVVEEYRRRYGATLSTRDFDLDRLAEIQGEHFDLFLDSAVEMIRACGKQTQIHLNVEFLRPDPRPSRHIAYPWNVRYDWRGWLAKGWFDEATLRTYQVTPDFVLEEDTFSREVVAACQDRGIPLHYNRYINGSPEHYAGELEQVYRDGRCSGFIVYETAELVMKPDPQGGVTTQGGVFEAIRDKARELGIAN